LPLFVAWMYFKLRPESISAEVGTANPLPLLVELESRGAKVNLGLAS
jgi:hypothetical protein